VNYFNFYNIKESFLLDEAELRQLYLEKSKAYHPDFFTLAEEAEQARVLELSTLNNEAYRTLSDFDKRIAYILREKGILNEGNSKNQIPPDFLMEMMEVNEALMELEFDFDATLFQEKKEALQEKQAALLAAVMTDLEKQEADTDNLELLQPIHIYYLKTKYLQRLAENLNRMELEQG
jgi:molecular chaperone HscB